MTIAHTLSDVALREPPGGIICPEQFRDLWSRTTESPGEVRLAMAVLVRAIEDLQRFRAGAEGSQAQRLYRHAQRWVASDDRQWPYSFLNVSEVLNVPFARIRTRLLEHAPLCAKMGRRYGAEPIRLKRLLKRAPKRPFDDRESRPPFSVIC
jgi:hypothetical protein